MLYILILLLISLIAISYVLNGKRLISTSFFFLAPYLLVTAIAAVNSSHWKIHFSAEATVLIFISCFSVVFGEFVAYGVCYGKVKAIGKNSCSEFLCQRKQKSKNLIIILTILHVYVFFAEIKYFYKWSQYLGNSGGILNMFAYGLAIRDWSFLPNPPVTRSFFHSLCLRCIPPISFYFLFLFISRCVYGNYEKKDRILLVAPILKFFINLLSLARSGFLMDVIYCVILTIILISDRTHWKKSNNKKIVRYSVIVLIIFFIFFLLMGQLTKKNTVMNSFEQISIYAGSSIVCFDLWLHQYWRGIDSSIFDLFTFAKNILIKVGYAKYRYSSNAPFISWTNGRSNIYTSIYAYLKTVGIIGNIYLHMILGFLFGYNFRKIQTGNSSRSGLIIFCMTFYAVVLSCIAERLCTKIFTITTLSEIIMIYLLDFVFCSRKKCQRR